ncbi:MAG: hypothetical protein GY865_12990, partial [candidate division Zixibacteria bacterium]|nr:hypothetical protein [candidate division Zixibacteria bacterium]
MSRNIIKISILAGLLLFILFLNVYAQSDNILDQKKELEKIKDDMDKSQKALDSLKGVEQSVLKAINNYDQQASANKAVLKRLNNRLNSVRKSTEDSKGKLDESQNRFQSTENRYLSNLNYYYMGG